MLTIKGYDKLDGRYVTPTYRIREIKEAKNFYDFYMVNQQTGFTAVIGLRRTSEDIEDGEYTYGFLWNGQPLPNSVSANWISDTDNMITALKNITEQKPW
jgi:hypothetical protein